MIEIDIPGYKKLQLKYMLLDYNGTLSCDGKILAGVKENLILLSQHVEIHIITADTFGKVKQEVEGIPCRLSILPQQNQDQGKLTYVKKLGKEHTVCIGNGRNDRLMLKAAALGIAVILEEGAAADSLLSADVICTGILSALALLTHPLRLTATLRS